MSIRKSGILIVGTPAIDSELNANSSNPIQNRAVTEALADKADLVDGLIPVGQVPALDYISDSQKGAVNGVATLNSSGKIPASQLPSMDYIPTSEKGTANGVASLDSSGKILTSQIPSGYENAIENITYGGTSAVVIDKTAQLSGLVPIPAVGSANLIITSGGTQVATFNANATSDVTVALPEGGGSSSQDITVIPAATTAYTLSEGLFTQVPTSATTYTLPAVSDNTHAHEIVLDVQFTNVQTFAFQDANGATVIPQDDIGISVDDVWRFLCQWSTLQLQWQIMPVKLGPDSGPAPSPTPGGLTESQAKRIALIYG